MSHSISIKSIIKLYNEWKSIVIICERDQMKPHYKTCDTHINRARRRDNNCLDLFISFMIILRKYFIYIIECCTKRFNPISTNLFNEFIAVCNLNGDIHEICWASPLFKKLQSNRISIFHDFWEILFSIVVGMDEWMNFIILWFYKWMVFIRTRASSFTFGLRHSECVWVDALHIV